MRARVVCITLTTALAVAACLVRPEPAFAQNREHQQMFADLRMLQEQVQQLRAAVSALADIVKTVTTKQDEQANATRKGFADQKLIIDTITDSVRILREKSDDTNVRISTVAHELENMRQALQSLNQSVAALAAAPPAAPPGGDPTAPGAPAGTTPPVTTPAPLQSPETLFDSAWGDYMNGQYELSIQGLQAYLRTAPKGLNAARAQSLIGESYFRIGRYREVIQAMTELVTTYKGSQWEDSGYYKRALAYEQLGMKEQAKADLQYVIKTFPDSTFAPLAKQILERIK
jgi:TolA-binding protein